MKINKIKINSYGKLKNKEINLKDGINIIYGKNEAGKSTLINFIYNMFYGISKNKNGKELSDYEKYKPWSGEEFSGKIEYELDNKEKYEVYRDFNKKNPKIFNDKKEDISAEFNIDKNKGNEFFYEQTKIDEDLFLSTLAINQKEVELEKKNQNILIQKMSNLAQTGDDTISYKRVIDRINRKQLEEIGSDRSREKPINKIELKLNDLYEEKNNLEQYKDFEYEAGEKEKNINLRIEELNNENNILKEIKNNLENNKIENEKIKIKENIEKNNNEKINNLNIKINELKNNIENKDLNNSEKNKLNIENKNIKNNIEKNKFNNKNNNLKNNIKIKKYLILFLLIILFNIFQFIFIKNKLINYLILTTIPIFLIYFIYLIKKEKNKLKINKKLEENKLNEINSQMNNYLNEINILNNNNLELENEIKKLIEKNNLENNLKIEKIKNNYLNKIEKNKLNNLIEINNLENINYELEKNQNNLNNSKLELQSLKLEQKNIEPKLENLAKIDEEIVNDNDVLSTLKNKNESMNLAKDVLTEAYMEMKNSVVPKVTKNIASIIGQITDMKYSNVTFNENDGLIVEIENGSYMPANRLSVGTIDQLYLALRLSMTDELSDEKVPIMLDETFTYFDDERLANILKFLDKNFKNRQILIFTCSLREKEIFGKNDINFNFVEL